MTLRPPRVPRTRPPPLLPRTILVNFRVVGARLEFRPEPRRLGRSSALPSPAPGPACTPAALPARPRPPLPTRPAVPWSRAWCPPPPPPAGRAASVRAHPRASCPRFATALRLSAKLRASFPRGLAPLRETSRLVSSRPSVSPEAGRPSLPVKPRPQAAVLYRGLGANLLRVVPATAVTFVVYEMVAKVLLPARARVPTAALEAPERGI